MSNGDFGGLRGKLIAALPNPKWMRAASAPGRAIGCNQAVGARLAQPLPRAPMQRRPPGLIEPSRSIGYETAVSSQMNVAISGRCWTRSRRGVRRRLGRGHPALGLRHLRAAHRLVGQLRLPGHGVAPALDRAAANACSPSTAAASGNLRADGPGAQSLRHRWALLPACGTGAGDGPGTRARSVLRLGRAATDAAGCAGRALGRALAELDAWITDCGPDSRSRAATCARWRSTSCTAAASSPTRWCAGAGRCWTTSRSTTSPSIPCAQGYPLSVPALHTFDPTGRGQAPGAGGGDCRNARVRYSRRL